MTELERAASICDAVAAEYDAEWERRERPMDCDIPAYEVGARECAKRIRLAALADEGRGEDEARVIAAAKCLVASQGTGEMLKNWGALTAAVGALAAPARPKPPGEDRP